MIYGQPDACFKCLAQLKRSDMVIWCEYVIVNHCHDHLFSSFMDISELMHLMESSVYIHCDCD